MKWDGLAIAFLNGMGETGDGLTAMSIISVKLPIAYDGIRLPKEVSFPAPLVNPNTSLHWFALSDLQPYSTPQLSYLAIGSDIATAQIQNPDGVMPVPPATNWDLPQFGTGSTSGNMSAIFLNGPTIDFTGYTNPDVLLFWDTTNLIEVYDNGTPGNLLDDIVTFNLANPFPITLQVREKPSVSSTASTDTTAPAEVLFPLVAGVGWNTLQWINPTDSDFDHVTVVRKLGSMPTGITDGEIIYEGYEPNFCDHTGASGTTYYYLITTVDYSGNRSTGVVVRACA